MSAKIIKLPTAFYEPEIDPDEIALKGMLEDTARIAYRAEWWGAERVGEWLAAFSFYAGEGDHMKAMQMRDELVIRFRTARRARLEVIGIACGCLLLAGAVVWLVSKLF